MLSQSDNVARVQPHVDFHSFTVSCDGCVFANGERDGAADTLAAEEAVLWKDVISEEGDVNICLLLRITLLADDNVWSR